MFTLYVSTETMVTAYNTTYTMSTQETAISTLTFVKTSNVIEFKV